MKRLLFIFGLYAGAAGAQAGNSTLSLRLADSLFGQGNWRDAASSYRTALQTDASNGRAWFRLGESLQFQQQYPAAIEAYQKSLSLPSATLPPVFIRSMLARAYALGGDSTSALNVLQAMVQGGYGNFPDLDTAAAFVVLKASPRFQSLLAKARSNAYPCLENAKNREFDFWIGNWDVFQTGTDYLVGKQRIEKASGGCLVLENWTAIGYPNEGKSMNFISPQTGKWEQVWMGSGGKYLRYTHGEYRDGALRYEGEGRDASGKPLLFHLSYFNLGPDRLRQLLEQSADGGSTWSTVYDFTYRRSR